MDELAEKILNRILDNPDYRAWLTRDAVSALADLGITLDPNLIPTTGVRLPPDDDVRTILKEGKDRKHLQCQDVENVIAWQRN